jgi:uncharacterized membrane protein YgcG
MIKPPVRARARALAIVVPFLGVLGVVAGACTEELRTNGQSCLKSNDCLSGVCANFVCVPAPPLLDAEVSGEGSVDGGGGDGGGVEGGGGGDAGADTSPPKDAGKDTAPPMEAATEAGHDGAGEGGTDGSTG